MNPKQNPANPPILKILMQTIKKSQKQDSQDYRMNKIIKRD